MECINKKCGSPSVNLLGTNAVSVGGMFREVSIYSCPNCKQNFSVAGNVTTKKDWKKKLEIQKNNYNNIK